MNKYEKIISLFNELFDELNALSKLELRELVLGIEISIWKDKVEKLQKDKECENK